MTSSWEVTVAKAQSKKKKVLLLGLVGHSALAVMAASVACSSERGRMPEITQETSEGYTVTCKTANGCSCSTNGSCAGGGTHKISCGDKDGSKVTCEDTEDTKDGCYCS